MPRFNRLGRWIGATLGAALCVVAVTYSVAAPAGASTGTRNCRDVSLPTGLSATSRQNLTLFGRLCLPASGKAQAIQVLVHGGTYDNTYWDFPGFGGAYSYAAYMNGAGYATLAIDLIGVGRSSHPLGATVTIQSQAYAIHSAVQAARAGALGVAYRRVVVVAHSLGTLTADLEVSHYQDVDGFIPTGTSHGPGLLGLVRIFSKAVPALLDPVTAPQVPFGDVTYLSTPNARSVFYAGGSVDPAVQAADEASRQPVPAGYAGTLAPYIVATPLLGTDAIDVPVLLVNGQRDGVFCAGGGGLATTSCASDQALYESERPFYSPAAQLQTYVLPDSGHDINLVPNAQLWYARALRWCSEFVPAS